MRNNGGEGHGLPGGFKTAAEIDALVFISNALAPVTPRINDDGDVVTGPADQHVLVKSLLHVDRRPVLIRKIVEVSPDRARATAQYYDGVGNLIEGKFEVPNVFSGLKGRALPTLEVFGNSWKPLCYLPERVTDSFTGRGVEEAAIVEWLNDEGSRSCLVYGDGGVGKTTLVVETIRRALDEDIEITWRPQVVTFYTAKRFQWGLDGLKQIGAGQPHLMDLLAHLHTLLLGRRPSADMYRKSVSQASTYLQEAMRSELDLRREDHLIILDNAETLIESDQDRDRLGSEMREISRRIGRVLLTSRRLEAVGADPVEVKALPDSDAIQFLREKGGRKLNLAAINRASDASLLAAVSELEKRPIVLEALLSALSDPHYNTLAKARKRVEGMLARDLGEFLFSDAWSRFSQRVRGLLVLMARVADLHDLQSLRICAEIAGVTLQDAEKALRESSGIASILHMADGLQVGFSRNFLRFCEKKDGPTESQVTQARSTYSRFVSRSQTFAGDRIAAAFRTPLARAAYQARKDGDTDAAKGFYEQAILVDSNNGWLFDRFAYFLFHDERNNPAALYQARRAVELLPNEGEVWYTQGIIESRMGSAREAEASLARAETLGVSSVRCSIQRAWAYAKSRPVPQTGLARRELLLLEARTKALSVNSRERIEVERIRTRIEQLEASER